MDPNLSPQALAAQNSFWRALLERMPFLGQNMVGTGMADQAAQALKMRQAILQQQEAQALGQGSLLSVGQTRGLLAPPTQPY